MSTTLIIQVNNLQDLTPLTSRKFFMAAKCSFPLISLSSSSPKSLNHSPYLSLFPVSLSSTHTYTHTTNPCGTYILPHFPVLSCYSTDSGAMQYSTFVTLNCDHQCLSPLQDCKLLRAWQSLDSTLLSVIVFFFFFFYFF